MNNNDINLTDFCYMRQGIKQQAPTSADLAYLQPIFQTNGANNRALLLIHGFASSPAVYRNMIPQLKRYDAIICPALPGHACNLKTFRTTTAEEWITFVENIYDQLIEQYQSIDVVGLSLGGLLACHLAKTRSINHLFLLAPALTLTKNIPFLIYAAKLLTLLGIHFIPNRGGDIYHSKHAELTYRKLPIAVIQEIAKLIQSFSYQQPNCPIDLFLGRYDKVVDVKHIAEKFAHCPHATIHWLENSAHVLPLDTDVAKIIACIKNHLP